MISTASFDMSIDYLIRSLNLNFGAKLGFSISVFVNHDILTRNYIISCVAKDIKTNRDDVVFEEKVDILRSNEMGYIRDFFDVFRKSKKTSHSRT
jgi:hypothetical protein